MKEPENELDDIKYPYTSSYEPPTHVVKPAENDKITMYIDAEFKKVDFNTILRGYDFFKTTLDI